MKRRFSILSAALIFIASHAPAWSFNSGSTGADGAFNPTENVEVQLPADGKLNYTTVNIPAGVTVTFKKNVANTPAYLLATGDVTIAGTISVNGTDGSAITPGKGGPGGFDGGIGGPSNGDGGKGLGPGGGNPARAYSAAYAGSGGGGYGASGATGCGYNYGTGGSTYGNVRIIPLPGGSGGGGGAGNNYAAGGGGGGGGALLIASSGTITITGAITANGGKGGNSSGMNAGSGGGGSGGAIKLMADRITGEGSISAVGGSGGTTAYVGGAGGRGRIRFEANTVTRSAATTPSYTYSYPGTVFVTNVPSLRIDSIAGVNVPESPTGKYGTPDITLPFTTTNPVTVSISATNIPVGTQVTVTSVPEYGSSTSVTSTGLVGTDASSTTTVSITLSATYQCILMAQATYTIQSAMYYEDERIEKVRVASRMGGESETVYITESGREIRSAELFARLQDR